MTSAGDVRWSGVTDVVRRWVEYVRRPRSRRVQAVIGIVSILLLAVGSVLAVRNLPAETTLRWWPIVVLIVVGTPWALAILTAEIRMTGHLVGVELDRRTSLRVAVVGSAMNQLPVPGAAITRLDALVSSGAGLRRSSTAIIVVGVVWVGTSLVVSGASLIGTSWIAALLVLGGGMVLVASWGLGRGLFAVAGRSSAWRLGALEVVFTLTAAARYALSLLALDVAFPLRAPLAMSASAALSMAVGIAPGGIGIKEGLATVFGDLAGVTVSVALLAALVDRLTSVVGALLGSIVVLPLTARGAHGGRARS